MTLPVYIQYLLGSQISACADLFFRWANEEFIVIISPQIMRELEKALTYPRLKKIIALYPEIIEDIDNLFRLLTNLDLTKKVAGNYKVRFVKTDPRDNKIVACAIEGQADYIVSADKKHLLNMKELPPPYEKIKIIEAHNFLKRLDFSNL